MSNRDSFASTPGNKAGNTYYFDATNDSQGRRSDANASWYSGSPHADAQHSTSSPLSGTQVAYQAVGEKAGAGRKQSTGLWGWCKRKPLLAILLLVLLIAAIGGIGGGVARSMMKDDDSSSQSNAATSDNNGSNSSGNKNGGNSPTGTTSGTSSSASPTSTPSAAAIVPLPAWNWADPKEKVMGVGLGNYLNIERWLDEDWFRSVAGDDVWDEWGLHQTLGPEKTKEVLEAHQASFIQESDFDQLVEYGLNTIRVPIPYWCLIPTQGNEPYVNVSQLDRLSSVMEWSHKRGLHVIIDLHAMPGSQSGDQASGHNTSNPLFFQPAYQTRSIQTVQTLINWIGNHPYKSVVSGVTPVNEPKAQFGFSSNDPDKLDVLRQFYAKTYSMLSKAKLPMIFHPSFYVGNALEYWTDFVTGKDPNMLIYSVHPYPGFFPSNSDVADVNDKVCTHARNSIGYPVPVLYGEWSAISGIDTKSFMKQYYSTQMSAWSWSAGGVFWTYKAVVTQNPVLANTGMQETMFSFKDLMDMGVIPKPAAPLSSNPGDYAALDFVQSFKTPACGPIPVSQIKWTNPATSGNSFSGRRRRDEIRAETPSWRRTSRQ
ncbi:unnamed protein product [Tilletia controversa]|uniref:glucan 1,3-beta-glucosidase n=3 Tax=Tilletia TaxID=13289 RepID=A0A8X7SV89_9BASI|nr:hypothetical protein CF336_g5957 [Tilletia laevis]KAE8191908.1 hypothetical protein CF328_g5540 [Tilletia controversa]KAE8256652.1 hypothetical protein A4X03_0g5194 [Tilletia caries]KAE8194859.1 hypothetical protein CF335_g5236 [Tilletia laevis]KAE8243220.1 hypothetical protein A4X06_0g6466 [Tilletia controversa]